MTTPYDPIALAARYPPTSDVRRRQQVFVCPTCQVVLYGPSADYGREYYSMPHFPPGSSVTHTLTARAAQWEFPAGTDPIRIWLPWSWT